MSYNPDQYTEPQAGLGPQRSFDKQYELFVKWLKSRSPLAVTTKGLIQMWEKFKEEQGLPALLG